MLIIAIETSCDETSIAYIKANKNNSKILSNVIFSQIDIHKIYGGVVPMLASREHEKKLNLAFLESSKNVISKLRLYDIKSLIEKIDLVVVTAGPGLMPSLLVGVTYAKLFATFFKKPIIGVNHLAGHLYSPLLNNVNPRPETKFPYLCLIASGGHTELLIVEGLQKYKILGFTLDDACGEAFDKVGRILGLDYPAGAKIENLASLYRTQDQKKIIFKIPMIDSRNFNFSYSGLKTAVLYKVQKEKLERKDIDRKFKEYIAWNFQEAALKSLVSKTIEASKKYNIKNIFVTGGVSVNQRLKDLFSLKIKNDNLNNIATYFPDKNLTQDNAAMIGLAGYFKYLSRGKKPESLLRIIPDPNLSL